MTDGLNYKIIQTVASGGTAVLYKAIQLSLDRVVAIKRLHQHLTTDDNFTRRFVLEARAAASLDHENIVRVIDFGVEKDCYQMVMEFIEGESLRDVLERWRPINPEIALALTHQVCRGLEHAHAKGIVHRDIKPGNVMLTKTGGVKIADFGLAKLTQGSSMHTAVDTILGTPLYMSPEQAFGESVDQRSDLFSLGTMLYELLTGKQPFASENYMGVIQNILKKEIPGIRELNPAVPLAAEEITAKALARNREERFQSARAFRESIEQALGLEGLNRALAAIPMLLDRNSLSRGLSLAPTPMAQTGINPRKSRSSAMARRKSKRPVWTTVSLLAAVACAAVAYFQFGPGTIPGLTADAPVTGRVQNSVMGDEWSADLFGAADIPKAPASAADTGATARPDTAAARGPAPVAGDTAGNPAPAMPWVDPSAKPQEKPNEQPVNPAPAEVASEPAPKPTEATPARTQTEEPERFREGYLLVDVEPSGQVYVNGVYRGLANPTLRLTLNAGLHSVECRSDKFEPYAESLRITAGETSKRTVILKKLKGIISLATTEGAELYIDGALIGVTPIMRPIEVDAGTHTLTIKKENHFTWSSEVTVEPNVTLPLRITLSPRY
ncbi:MAG TPA: protein kinase [Candidatus Krumholzibacteria bacterium]|nr:protein kinase [Candidatus Krumholzibacteria bacterium]